MMMSIAIIVIIATVGIILSRSIRVVVKRKTASASPAHRSELAGSAAEAGADRDWGAILKGNPLL